MANPTGPNREGHRKGVTVRSCWFILESRMSDPAKDLKAAYLSLTEAQANISWHRSHLRLCDSCRTKERCEELLRLAILEKHALENWIEAYKKSN